METHDKSYVYKVFLFDAWKQFYIMSESIEFSFTRYPVFRLRHVCFYQRSIFVLYFLLSIRCLAWRTTNQWRHYWQRKYRYPVWPHTLVPPSAFSRRAVVSYWRKYVHEVLVNRLGGLSLPRESVVRLTDRPDMTLDVYRGRKTTNQINK